jgi:FtsP/CotA-like multicopper oxidase with cupredoxin domain
VLTVQPRYVRFRVLNGAVSRALSLSFQDAKGKRYNDRCRIVGSDGGVIGKDRTGSLGGRVFPTSRGLFTSNAYRWDIVCDFRNLEGSLFLTNEPDKELMKPEPAMVRISLLRQADVVAGMIHVALWTVSRMVARQDARIPNESVKRLRSDKALQ